MKSSSSVVILPFVLAALGPALCAQPQSKSSAQEVKRGKYLVEEVAKCPDCHTPRDKNNQLDRIEFGDSDNPPDPRRTPKPKKDLAGF
jgi:hypothetical protein